VIAMIRDEEEELDIEEVMVLNDADAVEPMHN
jgi:hypothetical protein